MEYNNDPRLIEANNSLNCDVRSLRHEVASLKELNAFLHNIIVTLISK